MQLGYMRVSKDDGTQSLDLQLDALLEAGVDRGRIYHDEASGRSDTRPGLTACLKALRTGDLLVLWKLDRLGRNLRHLVSTVDDLAQQGIGLKVLAGQGANIDTSTANGRLVFGIFAALAEFEADLIRERTMAGLAAARARGRKGGRPFKLKDTSKRLALATTDGSVQDLATHLGVHRSTIYRTRQRHKAQPQPPALDAQAAD